MAMDFEKYLKSTAKELDKEIENILEEQFKKARETDRKLIPLVKVFIKSCQGGKRIRGALIKLGYQMVNGKSGEIIKIGAAYEIVHSAILVHDDIIDQSIIRRDKLSLHQALGGNHYGISQAISLGDYGFFLSYQIICETDFPDECKIKALNFFSQVLMKTVWGELLDLEETNSFIVMKLKTACYTISGPLQIGAILGGADKKLIRLLGEFGENLGIAYQIQDDILDLETVSVERAKKEAVKYADKALKILPLLTKDKKTGKLLEQMAKYLVERTR